MPGKRITELTALSGAGSANNDDVVIFDADAGVTKRISRSQLAEGMIGDLPFQYFVGVLTSNPTQRLNGDPLQLADTYYNSVADQISFYDGAAWVSYDSVLTARNEAVAARDVAVAAKTAAELAETNAETAETNAETAETNAETAETGAVSARLAAEAARDAAQLSKGLFESTAAALGNGVQGHGAITGGSGGTDGTFALAMTGGTEVVPVRGTFVVASGAVTQINVYYPGYYSSNPTGFDFTASSGLTSASATPTMGVNVGIGEYFSVPSTTPDELILYRVTAGPAATEVLRYPSAESVLEARAKTIDWLITLDDGNGGTLIPVFQYEPSLGLIWQNGGVDTVANLLTDNGDGSFTLNSVPSGLASGVTALVEWSRNGHTGTSSGYMWSMVNDPVSLAGGVSVLSNWNSGASVAGGTLESRVPSVTETQTMQRWGAERVVVSVPLSGNSLRLIDGGEVLSGSATNVYLTPTRMDIGRRSQTSVNGVIANISVTRVVVFGGSMTAARMRALNDAAERMDMTPQERWPEWLAAVPNGAGGYILPDLQFDPKRLRCWWRGKERAISDVLTGSGTDWIMKRGPRLTATGGVTIITDVQPDVYYSTNKPTGFAVHSSSVTEAPAGSQQRVEFSVAAAGATLPGGLFQTSGFVTAIGSNVAPSAALLPVALGGTSPTEITRGQGIIRLGVVVPGSGGGTVKTIRDAWPAREFASVTTYVTQDYFRFGAQFGGTNPLSNCDFEQAIVYDRALTKAQLEWVGRFNEYKADPLLFIGDSLNNVQQPAEQLRLHAAANGYTYLPYAGGGAGGRGLSFFEEYIDEWLTNYQPDATNYRLIIVEGGLDYQSLALDGVTTVGPYSERDFQIYLKNIFAGFKNQSPVLMQPNSNSRAEQDITNGNTVLMDQYIVTIGNMADTYPDFWCPIVPLFQAQAANDAEYTAIRADGRVPPALRGDGIHPSWGTAFSDDPSTANGYYWLSLSIFRHLLARNWITNS